MNFHFKQAFDYLKTPEGKAEWVLRKVIDTLNPNCINEIVCFRFFTYSTVMETINTPDSTTVCFSCKNTRDVWYQTFRSKTLNMEEAISILKIIEKHLTEEGYKCIPDEKGFTVSL